MTVPTRFYLPSTGAAAVAPANDAWNYTAGASAALRMGRAPIGSAMATITSNNDGTVGNTVLLRQFVSDPLPFAMTITGKVYGVIRCIESNAAASHTVAFSIRACSQDGTTIRSPALLGIVASDNGSVDPYEMARTTASASVFWDSTENCYHTLAACDIQATDRIVIEIGYRSGTTTTTRTGGIVCGDDSANDIPYQSIYTTADNPWIQFTADLWVKPGEGYFS